MEVITSWEIGVVIGLLLGLNITALYSLWVQSQSIRELKMLNLQLTYHWLLNSLEKELEKK